MHFSPYFLIDENIIFFLLIIPIMMYSQVGINTTTPSTASVLDVNSSNDRLNFGGLCLLG